MSNPYDPQSPAKPDYFGGRKQVLKIAIERINKAIEKKQSGGLLVYGYRGVGKTSVLRKILNIATPEENNLSNNTLAIYRRLSKTTSDSDLYQIITEDILEEISQRRNLLGKIKDVGTRIKSAKVFEIGIEIDPNQQKTAYHKWRNIIKNLNNVDCVIIAIDDADYLATEALGELKTIVEETNPTPVVLLISGGIEFETKLVDDYSPIARIFSGASFNLGEFELEETKEVLIKPIKNMNTFWAEDATKEVQELSRGYPYLVQCLAKASFIENGTISKNRVNASLKNALEIGKPWLNNEIRNASDIDITSFMKIIEIKTETIKSNQMNALGISPPYIGRLVKHGIIQQISRGRYKLKKPPIVALYHFLKRGLSQEEKPLQTKLNE